MQRKIYVFILTMILSSFVFAQTSNLKIIDFNISPAPVFDQPSDTNQIKLNIGFKCDDFSKADKAYLLFGSAPDNASVATLIINISKNGNGYKLSYNNIDFPVSGQWEAMADIVVEKSLYRQARYVTLYLKEKKGLITTHLNRQVKL